MKKIFALALVAVFCLAGYGVSAQTQSKNQKLSPKQEKREAREQRRAQRQAEYERYIDSLVTSGNFQFIPNSMRVIRISDCSIGTENSIFSCLTSRVR